MSFLVVIADDRHPGYEEETGVLGAIGAEVVNVKSGLAEDIARAAAEAHGIIVNLPELDADLINRLSKCKVISRYGVGYDNVDVAYATERGIWVANVPDYCAEDVSDQALALLMGCVRNVALRDRHVRAGIWDIKSAGAQFRMCGKTFAFFGYGRIAQALHRKLSGFRLGKVLVCDPFAAEETIRAAGAEHAEIEQAVAEADFISIHMPLNDDTRGLFNERLFKKMKKTAILVNTSRGPIIAERDLYMALSEGRLAAAGLDVFEKEPVERDNPLLTLDNVTVSGHTGWYTEESQKELKTKAAENVREVLMGRKPLYPVNEINSQEETDERRRYQQNT